MSAIASSADAITLFISVTISHAVRDALFARYTPRVPAREQGLEFLAAASAAVAESLDYEETLQRIAHSAIPTFADIVVVYVLDDRGELKRQVTAAADPDRHHALDELKRFPTATERLEGVLQSLKPWIVENIDPQTWSFISDPEHKKIVEAVGLRSLVAAPMRSGRWAYGVILLGRTGDRTFSPFEVLIGEEIARRAAGAIERSRLYMAEHKQRERLEHLQRLTEALAVELTVNDACDAVIREMRGLLGAEVVVIGLVSADDTRLEILRTAGVRPEVAARFPYIMLDAQIPLTTAIRRSEAVWLGTREQALAHSPIFREVATKSSAWAAIPLSVPGRTIGALGLSFLEEQEFPDDLRAFILSMARQTAQAIERARLFESEHAAREEAEKASRAKDEFLAILSHELRTPLTTVLGWADLLKMTYSGPDESMRFAIESLRASAATQARLIDDLLDVTRIITGKFNIEKRPTELTEIVTTAAESLRLSAESKGITMAVNAACCIEVDADPARLHQVVTNLVTNAIKFTPAQGRVSVSVQRSDGEAKIIVADTGIGIRADFLPHVFERFRQGSIGDSRTHSGLGLGLSIVQHLVSLHGGHVQAESDGPGHGARFTVSLPVRETRDA
jgi:signal transduction histidine kinase